MISEGDTWGIGGPVFLLVYSVLMVAVTVAVVRRRRALADVPMRLLGRLDDRPYDVAYLNGGAELALCAALSAMSRSGTITTAGKGVVVAAARPEPRADGLERAVHHATGAPVDRRQLAAAGAVASALHRIESRLVDAGLLLAVERRRHIRATSGWTFALAGLGIARIVAGIGNGRPVGFLVVLVLVVVALGLGQSLSAPRRSRAGDALLTQLADDHHVLSPATSPDWTVYGPAGAALAVAVFGLGALWEADPVFAAELALQRAVSGSGDGAGHTSSCSSGSSCGGGGCGGGCGG